MLNMSKFLILCVQFLECHVILKKYIEVREFELDMLVKLVCLFITIENNKHAIILPVINSVTRDNIACDIVEYNFFL